VSELPDDALDAAFRIARCFEQRSIPYAIGGALAYGQYGIPRATHDVDFNVFVADARLKEVVEALQSAGVQADPVRAAADSADQGLFVCHLGSMRIDIFTPSIDFSWEASRTRVQIAFGTEKFWFLSAEALTVFKLLFFRSKDIADLERLIAVRGAKLDAGYVRSWLVKIMGPDDPRTTTWDRLIAEFMPA
jgi:hypothetical protein